MKTPYFLFERSFLVSDGVLSFPIVRLRDKAELSREDRFMLEKHAQDIFRMLIGSIVQIDSVANIDPERSAKTRRLLEEYLETKALLEQD